MTDAATRLRTYRHPSPLGGIALLFDQQDRLRFLDFDDNVERLQRWLRRQGASAENRDGAPPAAADERLDAYFAGRLDALDGVPKLLIGTDFQSQVWAALEGIPAGSTLSYGALAQRLGKEAAVRAVGAAVGANPVSLVVPCHRVMGGNGSLTGYAGGLPRKRWLLSHEGALPSLAF